MNSCFISLCFSSHEEAGTPYLWLGIKLVLFLHTSAIDAGSYQLPMVSGKAITTIEEERARWINTESQLRQKESHLRQKESHLRQEEWDLRQEKSALRHEKNAQMPRPEDERGKLRFYSSSRCHNIILIISCMHILPRIYFDDPKFHFLYSLVVTLLRFTFVFCFESLELSSLLGYRVFVIISARLFL